MNDTLTRMHPESGLSVLGTKHPSTPIPFSYLSREAAVMPVLPIQAGGAINPHGRAHCIVALSPPPCPSYLLALAPYAHSLDCAPLSALQVIARGNSGHASASHKAPEAELRVRPATAAAKEPIGGSEAVFSRRHGHRRQVHSFCGATEHRTTWCWHCFC
jgi:hypothetical protein